MRSAWSALEKGLIALPSLTNHTSSCFQPITFILHHYIRGIRGVNFRVIPHSGAKLQVAKDKQSKRF